MRGVRQILRLAAIATLALAGLIAAAPATAGPRTFGPLELANLRGEPVSLEDLRGQVVVLNFWASWCKPCLEEMPALAKMSERFHRRGVKVIAASLDEPDSHELVQRLAERLPKPMEVWVGATVADMVRLEVGESLPVTVLIDRDGSVTHVHHGIVAEDSFDDTLRDLLDDRRDRNDRSGLTSVRAVVPRVQDAGRNL